jgi:hypothetical protein
VAQLPGNILAETLAAERKYVGQQLFRTSEITRKSARIRHRMA